MRKKPINIYKLPYGTKVRIKDNVPCHSKYKKGGKLVFQKEEDALNNEYTIGIEVKFGVCYEFHPSQYEIIEL